MFMIDTTFIPEYGIKQNTPKVGKGSDQSTKNSKDGQPQSKFLKRVSKKKKKFTRGSVDLQNDEEEFERGIDLDQTKDVDQTMDEFLPFESTEPIITNKDGLKRGYTAAEAEFERNFLALKRVRKMTETKKTSKSNKYNGSSINGNSAI